MLDSNARSAQKVFQMAKEKAAIKKEIGFHSLKHSFATHLLEKGTDIKYTKEILGHFNIKTTERYLHVSKKTLVNIVSPLDNLYAGVRLTGNQQLRWRITIIADQIVPITIGLGK